MTQDRISEATAVPGETNDLLSENLLTLSEASRHLPTIDGKRVSATSIWRWATKGLSTPTGRLYLESAYIGRRIVTSAQALARFTRAGAEARRMAFAPEIPEKPPRHQRPRTSRQRQRDLEWAEREAERLGV